MSPSIPYTPCSFRPSSCYLCGGWSRPSTAESLAIVQVASQSSFWVAHAEISAHTRAENCWSILLRSNSVPFIASTMVTLMSVCEHYLPSGAQINESTVGLVSVFVRSHNLFAHSVPDAWGNALLERIRLLSLDIEATRSLVAALQLLRLTLAEACASHIASCALKYLNALIACWRQHDNLVVRALVANNLEILLSRTYSCSSDFQSEIRARMLDIIRMLFATRSREFQLRHGPSQVVGSKSQPMYGNSVCFRREVLCTTGVSDPQLTALQHAMLSLTAVAFRKYPRTLKSIGHKIEYLAAQVLSLSPSEGLQEMAAKMVASIPHSPELWGQLMSRVLKSMDLQVGMNFCERPNDLTRLCETVNLVPYIFSISMVVNR